MKAKGSSSLYEVLKSASRAPGEAAPSSEAPAAPSAEGPVLTLQERLAAYKAAKLAEAGAPSSQSAPSTSLATAPATAVLTPEPDPTPLPVRTEIPVPMRLETILRPPPSAAVEPAPELDEAPVKGPGERVIRLTYNTAVFGGMVVAGLLFVAYAVGLHSGKGAAPVPAPAVVPSPLVLPAPRPPVVPAPAPAPAPRKEYTVRLGEWKYGTSSEKANSTILADDLKKALDRAGHRGATAEVIKRNGELRLALYIDKFADHTSESARAKLATLKNFKYKNTTPFAQATFEELSPR